MMSIHFPVIFLAILSLGAVATTTNPLNTAAKIIKQVKDSKARLAFTAGELGEKVKSTGLPMVIISQTAEEDHTFVSSEGQSSISFQELVGSQSWDLPAVKVRQEDTAALLYSSGTMGVSKGVIISHRNMISMIILLVRFVLAEMGINAWELRYLAVLPMFHVYSSPPDLLQRVLRLSSCPSLASKICSSSSSDTRLPIFRGCRRLY